MGLYEDDRIRHKNQSIKVPKQDEARFKLELHDSINITQVVESLVKEGFAVQLETNNRIVVKK